MIAVALQIPNYVNYALATSPLIGTPTRIYRGWPMDEQLRTDLKAGVSNITVFSGDGLARDTTVYLRAMTETITHVDTPTMTAVVSGNTVTFAGTGSINECIGVAYHSAGYAYRLSANDTPASVAAVFAANIPHATSSGAVLTIPVSTKITTTYGADITTLTEMRRQEQIIRVSVWTPTTELRDQICSTLDSALMWADRITFAENSITGPIRSAGTHVDDVVGTYYMWRRDLLYKVEYATTYKQILPPYVLGRTEDLTIFV